MSVYGFSDNKCKVPVVKQSEFDKKITTGQEENNDFLVKKMCLLHYGTTQPVVAGKYKNNTSITTGEYIETRFVEDFSTMFSGATKLTTVPEYDTTNANLMDGMFYNCLALTSIPELNTGKVTSMRFMFYNCSALTSIPKLNTSNVTNMEGMFQTCSALTSVPDLDTSKVANTAGMFNGCTSLTTLKDSPLAPEGKRWQFNIDVNFKSCPLDRTSILKVFNGLQTVTGKTITISSTTNSYLSEEDKAIATAKGWTVKVG